MSNLPPVQQFLISKGASFVSSVRINDQSNTVLLEIPHDRVRSTSGGGFTSKRQLTFLSRAIEKKFDLHVIIAFRVTRQQDDIVAGLRAILFSKYPDLISDVFASFPTQNTALVWVEEKELPDKEATANITSLVREFLIGLEVECGGVEIIGPALPEASTAAILRSVKILAPVDLPQIVINLKRRGFGCPSDKWLVARLDSARKRGLVLRSSNGYYSLSAQGVDLVPRSRSRSSSDIERMLLLAKRRTW